MDRLDDQAQRKADIEQHERGSRCKLWIPPLRSWKRLAVEWQKPHRDTNDRVHEPSDETHVPVFDTDNERLGPSHRLKNQQDGASNKGEREINDSGSNK